MQFIDRPDDNQRQRDADLRGSTSVAVETQ